MIEILTPTPINQLTNIIGHLTTQFQSQIAICNTDPTPIDYSHEIPYDLIQLVTETKCVTAQQLKNYITSKLALILQTPPTLNPTILELTHTDSMNLIHCFNQAFKQSLTLTNNIEPLQLQSEIEHKIEEFSVINPHEILIDQQEVLNSTKLMGYWPFLVALWPSIISEHFYYVEMLCIVQETKSVDLSVNLDNIQNDRYHIIIQISDRDQIVICYLPNIPNTTYIVQIIKNNLTQSIAQYNQSYKQSGNQFYYQYGQLKQIDHYQDGRLEGESMCFIQGNLGLIVPFINNQPHGCLKIMESPQKIIYTEFFYQGQSLLPQFNFE